MKDYKIERYGQYVYKIALVEQCNSNGTISFYYWDECDLPVDGWENTVAFFRVKQRKRVSWWRRLFKRLRNFR